MERFRRQFYDEMAREYEKEYGKGQGSDERYNAAYKKVKKIKGFYSHLKVYLIINVIIIASSLNSNFIGNEFDSRGLSEWHTYSTAFFWGIGLLIHAVSVFGPNIFFSEDWEQRKIKEFMGKDKSQKWE